MTLPNAVLNATGPKAPIPFLRFDRSVDEPLREALPVPRCIPRDH